MLERPLSLSVIAAMAALALASSGCAKREGTGTGGCLSGESGCKVGSPCEALTLVPATCSATLEVRTLTATDEPPGGSNALASVGDVLISNGKAVAVIAGIGNQNYVDSNGGTLMDLGTVGDNNDAINQIFQVTGILPGDTVKYTSLELINEAPRRVAVQAKGTLDGHPEVPVYTVYEMRPCEPGIRIRTEIVNSSPDPQLWFTADAYYWSKREPIPFTAELGGGFDHVSFGLGNIGDVMTPFPFLAFSAHRPPYASYAMVACNQSQISGVNSETISAAGLPKRVVPPRDYQVYERFLAVTNGQGASSAIDLALEARKQIYSESYVTLTGKVERSAALKLDTERETSVLISEGRLTADKKQRIPWTQVVPDSTGQFSARVPAGKDYVVEVSSFGEKQAEGEFIGVTGDRDLGTFTLPSTARVTFTVTFVGDAGPTPVAEIVVAPADEKTRAENAGNFHGQFGTCTPWLGPPPGASPACNRIIALNGTATVEIPAGNYHFYAFRGPFWTIDRKTMSLMPMSYTVDLTVRSLKSLLQPAGTVSADFHVHGGASFDSMLPDDDRVLSFAATDLDVIIATDHDVVYDYGPTLRKYRLESRMSAVTGIETTGHIPFMKIPGYDFPLVIGHYNFWPLKFDPAAPRNGGPFDELIEPGQLFDRMDDRWSTPDTGGRLIELNHPWADAEFGRDLGFPRAIFLNALKDLPAADDGTNQGVYVRAPGRSKNNGHHAQEVMNGTSNPLLLQYRAFWFYILNQGQLVTGTANSDSHSLVESIVGIPRNMVYTSTTPGLTFDVVEMNKQVRAGRVLGTNGPVIEATVDVASGVATYGMTPIVPRETGMLHVTVSAAPWIPVEEIRIIANGKVVKKLPATLVRPADPFGSTGLVRFTGDLPLSEFLTGISGDAWIVVEAGRPLMLADDLGGGLNGIKDGIPDTTDNNGDGVVDAQDIAPASAKWGPLKDPPLPASESDPQFHFSIVEREGYPVAFTNPFVLDRNNNGRFDAPTVTGGR